jgi:hypothetical protein
LNLRKEKPAEVSVDLFALSHGPTKRVTIASSCISNGVRFFKECDKHIKAQNSGTTTSGHHFTERMKKTEAFDHYGHLNDIIELSCNDKSA